MGFTTGFGNVGTYWFNEDKENTYVANTPNVADYKISYVSTPRQEYFRLYLKGCNDAKIMLSEFSGPIEAPGVVLSVGAEGNTRTFFQRRTRDNSDEVATTDTKGILECKLWQPFWISWINGLISFGKGRNIGSQVVLSWQSTFKRINSIGFTSPENTNKFRVRANDVEKIAIGSLANIGRENNFIGIHQQYFVMFRVRACQPVYISLMSADGVMTNGIYEVIIGAKNNMETSIWEPTKGSGAILATNDSPQVLSCGEYRAFWISWLGEMLRVGKGWRPSINEIISIGEFNHYNLQTISVSSESSAHWIFDEDNGDRIMTNTTGNHDDPVQWFRYIPDRPWISFSVLADADVHLILAKDYNLAPQTYYEVVIGHDNNMNTYLGKGSTNKRQESTPNVLLKNEPSDFWVSWEGGVIKFGYGRVRDSDLKLQWTDPQPHDVAAIGIKSGENNRAEWKFLEDEMQESAITLDPAQGFYQYWTTARHRQSLIMGIKAEAGITLFLSAVLGINDTNYGYQIYLNSGANNKSYIRTGDFNEIEGAADTPYLFNKNEERIIWMSWYGGVIMLGKGATVGKRQFLTLQDLNAIKVGAVGFRARDAKARLRVLHQDVEFASLPNTTPQSGGLSKGAIAGAFFGFLALFGLFGLLVYFIFKPPTESVKAAVTGTTPTPAGQAVSFENPLQGSETQPSG